jgi:hypothetical protein
MTKQCKTCITPNACEICNLCDYRDMEVIERAMARVGAMQRPEYQANAFSWPMFIIIAAFAVWVVAMLVKTGVLL